MRLICPNCDAQYEVPDDVIPREGRDVQCSNCSNTWFFKPVDLRELEAQEAEDRARASMAPPPEEEPAPAAEAPDTPRPRRKLDPEIANVLREEAEYEARARAAERNTLETQPELGLPPTEERESSARRRAEEARARMARMRGETVPDGEGLPQTTSADAGLDIDEDPATTTVVAAAEGTRRSLLPDIDQINSTLSSENDRVAPQTSEAPYRETPEPKGKGRWGFLLSLTFAGLALVLYLFAEDISVSVPALAGPLADYVAAVDTARAWLDQQVLAGLAWLDSLSSGGGSV